MWKEDWLDKVGLLAVVLLLIALAGTAGATIPDYHTHANYLLASPGAMGVGLYGYVNPALLTYLHQPDLYFAWSDAKDDWSDLAGWGFFGGFPGLNLGFGTIKDETAVGSSYDYRFSFGMGKPASSFGIQYNWSAGSNRTLNRSNFFGIGWLGRPIRYLSIGAVGQFSTTSQDNQGIFDVAVRPLGDERLAVYADYALQRGMRMADGPWSAGAVWEVVPGIRLTGRYFDTEAFTLGLSFSVGHAGATAQGLWDSENKHGYNTYGVRAGAYDRNVLHGNVGRKRYLRMSLKGPVKYQRFIWFDKSTTLLDIIEAIEMAKNDKSISGIAVNTSGMQANIEMKWEIRDKLAEFRKSGKKVVVYVDDAGLSTYLLASVADRIVMDSTGGLAMPGMIGGRTYLKGTLDRLGIGFDEWRFFKYKSAYEGFSREDFSEGDEEQIKRIIDEAYRITRETVCDSRGIDPAEFDRIVDEMAFLLPEEALELGLVDEIGKWDGVERMIKQLEGQELATVSTAYFSIFKPPRDDHWGNRRQIALIYALGVCAMDEGITARKLSRHIDAARRNRKIEAVVFRVDSPGGSGMASDLVAEAIKRCAKEKPVIVSQGAVAASGGYWISMYADKIVASPATITGSIGVIGGWFYNKGLTQKLGMSTDFVKAGEHADLGFGATIPLLGIRIPDRNLTDDEFERMKYHITDFYRQFVEKVAEGRSMEYDEVDKIGQGRVWLGTDGRENGLVDKLGGLDTAIRLAKREAGIDEDEKVELIEMPKPRLLSSDVFAPRLFGMEIAEEDEFIKLLKFRMKHNGDPLPMLPMEQMGLVTED
jgi:protease-4